MSVPSFPSLYIHGVRPWNARYCVQQLSYHVVSGIRDPHGVIQIWCLRFFRLGTRKILPLWEPSYTVAKMLITSLKIN